LRGQDEQGSPRLHCQNPSDQNLLSPQNCSASQLRTLQRPHPIFGPAQQVLMIWSTLCQLFAKDAAPQFRYLARPQNPRSMNSSSISECCVVNGDAATRIQRWPAGCV